uniref:Uncharacterized protein n=1 Tax=Romanomermis culicivorax TaxID=13658 RepID=A0A915KM60_ROMCU
MGTNSHSASPIFGFSNSMLSLAAANPLLPSPLTTPNTTPRSTPISHQQQQFHQTKQQQIFDENNDLGVIINSLMPPSSQSAECQMEVMTYLNSGNMLMNNGNPHSMQSGIASKSSSLVDASDNNAAMSCNSNDAQRQHMHHIISRNNNINRSCALMVENSEHANIERNEGRRTTDSPPSQQQENMPSSSPPDVSEVSSRNETILERHLLPVSSAF